MPSRLIDAPNHCRADSARPPDPCARSLPRLFVSLIAFRSMTALLMVGRPVPASDDADSRLAPWLDHAVSVRVAGASGKLNCSSGLIAPDDRRAERSELGGVGDAGDVGDGWCRASDGDRGAARHSGSRHGLDCDGQRLEYWMHI